MDNIREILSLIYDRFYLRDFFGKIVPGFIFCGGVYITLEKFDIIPIIEPNLPMIFVLIGISWILGFCVQSFGELIKIIRYYPKSYEKREDFFREYQNFQSKATEYEKEDVERFVVIKEACGNFCSAILLTCICCHLIFLNFCGYIELWRVVKSFWSLYIVGLFVFCCLFYMHRAHVKRQDEFMKVAVSRKKEKM
jgi:hypothetical protein